MHKICDELYGMGFPVVLIVFVVLNAELDRHVVVFVSGGRAILCNLMSCLK